ncbi:MAG: type VI secretion system baseplate subunit TssK [Pirellulaceae bacterium]|nr:type VI secretion system baseplate subunit TssK [Pirellulaceae bacterium]
MRNPAVNWFEGMFLRPHHFQAADRYWNELLATQVNFGGAYGYGVFHVNLSTKALSNGILEFTGLRARWHSGTVVSQEDNHVERIALAERLTSVGAQPVMVYLAIPMIQEGQPNLTRTAGGMCRYVEFPRQCDEEAEGGNRQEVSLKKVNYRVLLAHEELTGFEVIPLTRIVKVHAEEGGLAIDADYFPPVLTIQSWPQLAGVMRAIFDLIGSRLQVLSEIIKDKNISLSSQAQGDAEKMLLIQVLNQAYGELNCLAFAAGVHPLVAYTALCKIVGMCTIFGDRIGLDNVPRYDHDDLATIFRWAHDQIRKLIYAVKEDDYEQRYFVGSGTGMMVQLEPDWFGLEWDWYFGVDPINVSKDECVELLANLVDWRLGSADQVEQYMVNRQPGVKLKPVPQAPRALPSRGNWVYYQIRRDGHPWQHVQSTQTMAMRVKTQQVANLDSLEGTRRLRLSVGSKMYSLEFAIFAVRKRI